MEASSQHINLFFERLKAAHCTGVVYSLPFQKEFEILIEDLNIDTKDTLHPFIFFPFDENTIAPFELRPHYRNEDALEFLSQFQKNNNYWVNPSLTYLVSTSREVYDKNFKNYQNEIKSGKCSKAILSTIIKKEIPKDFNIGKYILKLREAYPQAFIYLFSSHATGTWIGATPETLLKWENGIVSTMSLAGTRQKHSSEFGIKEEKEQKIVTEYIDQTFRARFSSVQLDSTTKLAYGDMEHLITKVEAKVDDSFTRESLLELAAELHPTPAVGGYPKKEAINLIKETEIHSRLYYSGYLGPICAEGAHLSVNLRCMCLGEEHVYAYAGGGLTADSVADLEWEETRLKAQALLKFL